ncbi:MAG: efflux RND transporter periplasmic adaptor subunit [Lachnospiraceae bacterium]|nr:efflux RND transporter periplasmic adaptor subunit [Lachnospiraceae bacterium]
MNKRYKAVMCGILTLTSITFTGCGIFPEEEIFETATIVKEYEKKEFSMVKVQRGDVCDYKRIACIYSQSNTQDIELGTWDIVSKIYVKKGDKVKKGDVLITFSDDELERQIEDYKYEISVKEALIRHARKNKELEIEKQKIILDDKSSIHAIEEAYNAEISGYQSDLELIKLKLEQAEANNEASKVRAEMDGTVTLINNSLLNNETRFGDWGGPGSFNSDGKNNRLMTISDGSKPRFTGSIDSIGVQLEEGSRIDVICNNNTYAATVKYKDKDTVYFMLDDMHDELGEGATAYARYVVSEKKDVLYLPVSAVTSMGEDNIVYMDDGNGFKQPVKVQTGLTADNRTEIVSGLQEGDSVIVR